MLISQSLLQVQKANKMINIIDYKSLESKNAATIEERKTPKPKTLKYYSHHNYKKGISEGVVLECLRLWEKEKKNREKLSTLKIINVRENHQKTKELNEVAVDNEIHEFQDQSCLPSIDYIFGVEKLKRSVQNKKNFSLQMMNKTKNVFRVKLSFHVSKTKSNHAKSIQEDNIDQLNINLKTINHRSVKRPTRLSEESNRNQTMNNFYSSKVKRQIKPIKIQQDLLKSNDFILSPW